MEKLEMQEAAIPDVVELFAVLDNAPQCSPVERVICWQMWGLVNDAVAAFEITIMPDDDFVLACDALGRDIADLEYSPCTD